MSYEYPPPTQTYFAKSVITDLTSWAFVVLAAILDPDVQAFIVSLGANPAIMAKVVVGAGLLLRYFHAKRPVALIPPGEVKPVQVRSL